VQPGPRGPGAAGPKRGLARPGPEGPARPGPGGNAAGRAARNPACRDVPGLRFLPLTCPITLDTERYLADDTKGRRSCGVLNARMVERSGSAERHEGRQAVMATSVVSGRLTAIAVVIPGGDPLPRAGPGGLPHPSPRA